MSVGIIFLVCLAVASGVIYWQISRSGVVDVKKIVAAAALTIALSILFNLGTTPAPAPKPTTAPAPAPQTAPKPEPTATPTPPPSPQPAPQTEPSLTFEEFDKRFLDRLNVAAQTLGVDPAESMGTPEHRGNMLVYQISSTAHMEELITAAGGLRGVNIVTHDLDQSTIKSALIFYFCAIMAFDPSADINTVVDALDIDPNIPDVRLLTHATINGVTYKKKFLDEKALVFSIKR